MKKIIHTGRYLAAALAGAAFLLGGVASLAQSRAEYDALRVANMHLRSEVDSLRRELNRLRGTMAFSKWDELTGVEEDGVSSGLFVAVGGMNEQGRSFSGPTDSQFMTEIRLAMPCVTLPYNRLLDKYIDTYSISRRKSMPYIMGRYNAWLPVFREAFRRHGVPEELTALCIVESAVSPKALSPAGALGVWQFMPETARRYGLRVDQWVDERMDITKATDAAARYLMNSYNMFGRWDLAVDAYNCGPGGIRRALVNSRNATDFWRLNEFLPQETQGYFPALVGVRYVLLFGEAMGIVPAQYARPALTLVTPGRQVTLKNASEATGIPLKTLQELNPHILKGVVPPDAGFYVPTDKLGIVRTWLDAAK